MLRPLLKPYSKCSRYEFGVWKILRGSGTLIVVVQLDVAFVTSTYELLQQPTQNLVAP